MKKTHLEAWAVSLFFLGGALVTLGLLIDTGLYGWFGPYGHPRLGYVLFIIGATLTAPFMGLVEGEKWEKDGPPQEAAGQGGDEEDRKRDGEEGRGAPAAPPAHDLADE